jgi:hypothetical protein
VFLSACPFAEATGEGSDDMAEVAISQVQQEFFEGILDLNPRVIPGIGFIKSF